MSIVIINYELSNLNSVLYAIKKIYDNVLITQDTDIILKAKLLILPGIGTYKEGVKKLKQLQLFKPIREAVLIKKIPIIGICLGMQLLSTYGEEGGLTKGLNIIEGIVSKIPDTPMRVPHIGWNSITHNNRDIFNNISNKTDFYFIHSYYFRPMDKKYIQASTYYNTELVAVIVKNNIYGLQFHPEKSQLAGQILLQNIIKKYINI